MTTATIKDTFYINIVGLTLLSPETLDDIMEILSYTFPVEDVVESVADADITLFTIPGVLNRGFVWERCSMERGESRIPGMPHKYNPLIPEDLTPEKPDSCDDILFFFPAELAKMKESMTVSYALASASLELLSWLFRYVDWIATVIQISL